MLKCSHIYNDCSPTTKQCNFVLVLLPSHFRPRRSRSAAAIVIKLSRGRSVGQCVGASVGLSVCIVEKGGSDPDAVWHHKSGVSRDEAGSGVWGSLHGKGYLWGRIWGAPS